MSTSVERELAVGLLVDSRNLTTLNRSFLELWEYSQACAGVNLTSAEDDVLVAKAVAGTGKVPVHCMVRSNCSQEVEVF